MLEEFNLTKKTFYILSHGKFTSIKFMQVITPNLTFSGLRKPHTLELTSFRALKDSESIDNPEKFSKAFTVIRDIVENLGLQKECFELESTTTAIRVILKKGEHIVTPGKKLESKVLEINFSPDAKKDRTTIKQSSGLYANYQSQALKLDSEVKGDFTLKELKKALVEFYKKNESVVLAWEEELLKGVYNSIKVGDLPSELVPVVLSNADSISDTPHTLEYLRLNAGLANLRRVVDKEKIDPARPLEEGNIREVPRLELGLRDRTAEEFFRLLLERKEKEQKEKLSEKKPANSDPLAIEDRENPGVKKKEKPDEIKIPDVTPILFRDEKSGTKEFFLPTVLASYQKDLNVFFEKLNLGITSTFHYKDGHASVVFYSPDYKGDYDKRPQVTLRIKQDINRADGHVGSRIKVVSKNLAEIKDLTTINGGVTNGNGGGHHHVDSNGAHTIEDRPISGTLEVRQIDFFVFKVAQIFANAIRANKKSEVTPVVASKPAPPAEPIEDYVPAS